MMPTGSGLFSKKPDTILKGKASNTESIDTGEEKQSLRLLKAQGNEDCEAIVATFNSQFLQSVLSIYTSLGQ